MVSFQWVLYHRLGFTHSFSQFYCFAFPGQVRWWATPSVHSLDTSKQKFFHNEACVDVVKKPKLDSHYGRCKSSFTCVDCSTTFSNPAQWKGHTSCVSEAEKYQKSLYKGKKAVSHCLTVIVSRYFSLLFRRSLYFYIHFTFMVVWMFLASHTTAGISDQWSQGRSRR